MFKERANPFAKETTTASSHTTGFYKSNFYTVDPNFTTAGGTEYLTGIIKNTLDAATREPKVEWVAESATVGDNYKYCIENTMVRSSVRLRVWYLRDSMHLGSLVNLL
jgi:hypothetical protein